MKKRLILFIFTLSIFGLTTNFLWQLYQKPAEIVALLSWSKSKSHKNTWQSYGDSFKKHSTPLMTPSFLAALAQIESGGNPLATPQWKFRFTDRLSKIFSPQSSSVGLYQFTRGTFDKANRYCIRDGQAQSVNCWMNSIYTRVFPSHSIEVASAYLDTEVHRLLEKYDINIGPKKARRLAGIIHLCGSRKAEQYIKSGFNVGRIGQCGSHSPRNYLRRLRNSHQVFASY